MGERNRPRNSRRRANGNHSFPAVLRGSVKARTSGAPSAYFHAEAVRLPQIALGEPISSRNNAPPRVY